MWRRWSSLKKGAKKERDGRKERKTERKKERPLSSASAERERERERERKQACGLERPKTGSDSGRLANRWCFSGAKRGPTTTSEARKEGSLLLPVFFFFLFFALLCSYRLESSNDPLLFSRHFLFSAARNRSVGPSVRRSVGGPASTSVPLSTRPQLLPPRS